MQSIPHSNYTLIMSKTPNPNESPALVEQDNAQGPPSTIQRQLSTLQRFNPFNKPKTEKPQPIVFPPPSWALDYDETTLADTKERGVMPSATPDLETVAEYPEPRVLAKRIRDSIDSLPEPNYPSSGVSTPLVDPKGPPPAPGVDSKLTAFLSSETIMNGYNAGKESVFSVLERLKQSTQKDKGKEGDESTTEERGSDGIMMYTPLIPTSDSQAELAEYELEYADPEEFTVNTPPNEPTSEADVKASAEESPPTSRIWTFGKKPKPTPPPKKGQASEAVEARPPADNSRIQRVWVPSDTQISVQVTWWGYRIYLPPPVMEVLDGGHLVATKRAAMVTAALKWLLDKVPQVMVPPPLRPALMLFKRLAPFLGYIGIFIAWGWKSIKAHDKGNGVTLTATWLLTMALIPSTWEPEDNHEGKHTAAAAEPKTEQPEEGLPGQSSSAKKS
ncbi:hypothetical protein HGRIS_008448 [Hohenbuehelia grisea]|uniref:Uncharacterized protein n=1 Tax=Hohenbuehelia grisea TaxID=104357 RepID=A0ABR3J880_9AGAR